MTDTASEIAVVKLYYAEEEQYREGYERFEDADTPADDPTVTADDWHPLDSIDQFTESATFANIVHPRIRAAAGYADAAGGTYTTPRKVAVICPGCEEDEPADAVLREAGHVEEVLIDAWRQGAYDALDGRDADPERIDGSWRSATGDRDD